MIVWSRAALGLVPVIVCLWFTSALHGQAWDDVDGPAAGEPESIGRYAAGCVVGAARLPPNGAGYLAIHASSATATTVTPT